MSEFRDYDGDMERQRDRWESGGESVAKAERLEIQLADESEREEVAYHSENALERACCPF